jgi:hypothetical protein
MSVVDPSLALQQAIRSRLIADAGVSAFVGERIYDDVPSSAVTPYLAFGAFQVFPERGDCLDGAEVVITLDGYAADKRAMVTVKGLGAAVAAALDEALIPLETPHRLVELLVEPINYLRDPDNITGHAALTIRAKCEPYEGTSGNGGNDGNGGPIAGADFAWEPGLMALGGIASRTTIAATLTPLGGGNDDAPQIQAAIAAAAVNTVVKLNAGTFTLLNPVLINKPVTLRGSGPGVTILFKSNGAHARTSRFAPVDPSTYTYDAQPIIVVGPSRFPGPDSSTSRALTIDGVAGEFSVALASASGFVAGEFVLLDELSGASWQPTPIGFPNTPPVAGGPYVWKGDVAVWNMHWPVDQFVDDCAASDATGPYDSTPGVLPEAMGWFSRFDRPTNEIKEIASIAGNTITFTSPLAIHYRVSHAAQLTRYTATGSPSTADSRHVKFAGVEDLTVKGGGDHNLVFANAAYSWAKNIESTQWLGHGVEMTGSFRVEVRDSNLHTASWPTPGGAGYAIAGVNGTSEALIENNIIFDANKVMVFNCCGSGSVIAYNYCDDGWISFNDIWQEVGLNASHMTGPHHVLFEGNYCFNADSDYTHGSSSHLTFFRNHLSGQRLSFTDSQNVRCAGLSMHARWCKFVGNVLGRPGQMGAFNYTDPAMSCDLNGGNCTGNNAGWDDPDIWKLGYDAPTTRADTHPDIEVLDTTTRDGNYDFLTNSQKWHTTPATFVIGNSLYLTAKPAFFGANPWPWVEPATGTLHTLPAKARFVPP